MAMDRLEAMRLYTRIVELGSFTAAADDLNLPRATVTHAIKRLEARLGAQLLQRTTRRVRATRVAEALASGRLREILPEYPPPSLPMTILYPQQRQMPARLRVFVDWLVELTAAQR